MQRWQRSAVAVLGVLWVLAFLVMDAVSHTTRHVKAERVPAQRWQEAMARPARLPILWNVADHARPPLLPARGEYTVASERIALNGAAIVGAVQRREIVVAKQA